MKTLPLWIKLSVTEEGPTAVEYAVMLALIITVCIFWIWVVGIWTMVWFDVVSTILGGS
jgi:Flp pilus assembly pilin Flp